MTHASGQDQGGQDQGGPDQTEQYAQPDTSGERIEHPGRTGDTNRTTASGPTAAVAGWTASGPSSPAVTPGSVGRRDRLRARGR